MWSRWATMRSGLNGATGITRGFIRSITCGRFVLAEVVNRSSVRGTGSLTVAARKRRTVKIRRHFFPSRDRQEALPRMPMAFDFPYSDALACPIQYWELNRNEY